MNWPERSEGVYEGVCNGQFEKPQVLFIWA